MADTALMEILNTRNEFPVELCSLLFVESRISDNEVKKLTAVTVFHDHEQLFLGFDNLRQSRINTEFETRELRTYLIKLDDIWVSHFLEDFDLTCDPLYIFLVMNLLLL